MKRVIRETHVVAEPQAWCDACHVRVAPYEDFVTHNNHKFHRQCFAKSDVKTASATALVDSFDAAMA
jgi:hypothetical protein